MTFGRPTTADRRAAREAEKAANLRALCGTRASGRGTYQGATAGPVAKADPVRSEEYRRLVASLPCVKCCIVGYSQAAHPNTGKGTGIKADDRECFPLCSARPGVQGCHAKFDQGALFTKDRRRELEPKWAAQTRAVITGMGLWPKNLPEWGEA